MSQAAPSRKAEHDQLAMFLGTWSATGTAYGGTDQSGDPRANGVDWTSTHKAFWHTGEFFLIQDERAIVGGKPFDTLAILGVAEDRSCFSRGFENNGFYRRYRLELSGHVWTFDGETERARIEFSQDGRRQDIVWEWKPEDRWLPLCDRVAIRNN